MKTLCLLSLIVLASGLPACAHHAAQTPALQAVAPPPPPGKNWLEKTGDATWNAVATPVRVLTPAPKPKPQPLQPLDPPELTIVTRANRGVVTEEADPAPTTAPRAQP